MAKSTTLPAEAIAQVAASLSLPLVQVRSVVGLLDDGNTIPFIARYRKEATGGLDEIQLRAIEDAAEAACALAARKTTVLKTLGELDVLTPELLAQIEGCTDLRTLEDIYLPYKPKRRTRATIARERGLQPLADLLLKQQRIGKTKQAVLAPFVNPANEIPDAAAALAGALDIVAEQWSEQADIRAELVEQAMTYGKVVSKLKRGKKEQVGKFELYVDREEPIPRLASHRFLAMQRGAAEGILRVQLQLDESYVQRSLRRRLVVNRDFEFYDDLLIAVEDCYQRLLLPATDSTVMQALKEKADEEAIAVFGKNLHELLMAPPAGPKVTIGIDPGFRTGCKVAVVDQTGKFLENATIYATIARSDSKAAAMTLLGLIRKHNVELIAIGNGTASRETDAFVAELIKTHQLDVTKVIVSESGASIYSASKIAAQEFPDLDVTVRGAISIARRLQDPLAELVKTDPKSIGVGQYQHDVNQAKLQKCLDRTVESCVNSVGVDLNMASVPLLAYVAGIGAKLAENIVDFRNTQGRFTNRKQLASVPKLGKKAFEQAAGFLRIRDGEEPLDNSAVHPESYGLVGMMARQLKTDTRRLVGNPTLSQQLQPESFADSKFGLPTVIDIIGELAKPGRDPRSKFKVVKFNEQIKELSDLKSGLVLEGVITNVTHFGAFCDIGVHQDGLIHISQLANEFVSDPSEVVSVGDVVRVKVLEVDVPKKRISLTRKF